MGCGVSTFDAPIAKPKPTRINPRLHHRIEELKRRKRSRSLKKVTHSKKELLRHSSDEEVGESNFHSNPLSDELQKNTYSREDIESCITSEGSKKPSDKIEDLSVKVSERLMQNVMFKGTIEGNVQGDAKVENDENLTANAKGGVRGDEEEDGSGDGSDDEKRIGNNDGVFPGSPSFRIYYIEHADADKINSDNENPQLKETTCHAQSAAQIEVAESLKDSGTMAEKKGRKRRGFARGRKITCY